MNYIVTGKHSNPTMLRLGGLLSSVSIIRKFTLRNGNTRWKILRNGVWERWKRINEEPVFTSEDKVLFWGQWPQLNTGEALLYNKVDRVRDKYNSRVKMRESNVPIPTTYRLIDIYIHHLHLDDQAESTPLGENAVINYPVIIRPLNHSGGTNFLVKENQDLLLEWFDYIDSVDRDFNYNRRYVSEIYNKQREIRVHVAHGKVLLIQEKPLVEGVIQANRDITEESWETINWDAYRTRWIKPAVDAVRSLNLDFGAVDVMINETNTDMPVCICEVNTSPGLSGEYSLNRYVQYINWLFAEQRGWFNYEQWEAGKSYAFKNFQLQG